MAFLAVNSKGIEYISYTPLTRKLEGETLNGTWIFKGRYSDNMMFPIPNGSIEKLIGRKLTWEDEPVELKERIL